MPVNPAGSAAGLETFAPVMMPMQAALFLFLLFSVPLCDLKWRIISDGLQLAIAALTFLCFSSGNLLGVLGALPYLVIALFFGGMDGMGGGDIKLAAATGMVLLYPNIEYACASGMSCICTDTKGDLFRNYAGIAGNATVTVFPCLICETPPARTEIIS